MKLLLFTDTLGDVNGVSRFIRNVAELALESRREMTVFCSTRFEVPRQANIVNFRPRFAPRMPGYENLELAIPPAVAMIREALRFGPDIIHVSTPGPVGCVGVLAAKMLGVPLAGVYHTDFPAYVENLFRDPSLTWLCESFMSTFYGRFRLIFTRSVEYTTLLERLDVPRDRLAHLRAGIRVEEFRRERRDLRVWNGSEASGSQCAGTAEIAGALTTRLLYVGRVSVEKNLPLLARVWSRADAVLRERNLDAELVVIGDGPYRAEMEGVLASSGARVRFLGFKYGEELSTYYASSDLFVFPSITDTLGQVVMEAQAAGLPVLVTDQGGPKEVVRHGETGLVLRHDRAQDWIDAIVGLVGDEPARARMGIAANAFMQPFSIQASFEHYWEMHERACVPRRRVAKPPSA